MTTGPERNRATGGKAHDAHARWSKPALEEERHAEKTRPADGNVKPYMTTPRTPHGAWQSSGGVPSVRGKVLVLREVDGIWPEYRPKKGTVYDAEITRPKQKQTHGRTFQPGSFCIIDIGGKRIVLRPGEYREVEA